MLIKLGLLYVKCAERDDRDGDEGGKRIPIVDIHRFIIVTIHPAAALHTAVLKRRVWKKKRFLMFVYAWHQQKNDISTWYYTLI